MTGRVLLVMVVRHYFSEHEVLNKSSTVADVHSRKRAKSLCVDLCVQACESCELHVRSAVVRVVCLGTLRDGEAGYRER